MYFRHYFVFMIILFCAVSGCRRDDKGEMAKKEAVRTEAAQFQAQHIREIEMINIETGKASRNNAYYNEVTREFRWTPGAGDRGKYRLNIKARGQGQVQEEEIIITVKSSD